MATPSGSAEIALPVQILRAELADQRVLGVVGVLILIDQDVPEPPPILLAQVRERLQQVHGGHDQVVEVQRVRRDQPALVLPVRLGVGLLDRRLRPGLRGLVVDQVVLAVRHPVHQRPDRETLRVEVEIVGHQLHQPAGVGVVVDREAPGDVEPSDLRPQDPDAGGVEGGDPHQLGPVADQVHHPASHLRGRLVGEGDGQDRTRMHPPLADQIRDPPGQHPGLARAGPRHDQDRSALVQHRLALRRVQPLQQLLGSRPGGSRRRRRAPPGAYAGPRAQRRRGRAADQDEVRSTCRDPP